MSRLKRFLLLPVCALEALVRSGAAPTRRGIRPLLLAALACLGGSVVALGGGGVSPVYASGGGSATCSGGSPSAPATIAGGTYNTLIVTGICATDSGAVTANNVIVTSGGWLLTAFGAATGNPNEFTAKNLTAGVGTVVILGCEPEFACLNDPGANTNPTYTGTFSITGNLTTAGADSVIAHNGTFSRNVTILGGGGGTACPFGTGPLQGNPYYDDVEDTTIGGNLTIAGVSTCWLGTFRDQIAGNMIFTGNTDPNSPSFTTGLPDGNEIATNQIGRNLICEGNNPTPQFGDSGGSPDTVGGRAIGQCTAVVG